MRDMNVLLSKNLWSDRGDGSSMDAYVQGARRMHKKTTKYCEELQELKNYRENFKQANYIQCST